MDITTHIDEEELTRHIIAAVVDDARANANYMMRHEILASERKGIEKAIKEYIYADKEKIINKVIDRATVEIKKKAWAKMLDDMKEAPDETD